MLGNLKETTVPALTLVSKINNSKMVRQPNKVQKQLQYQLRLPFKSIFSSIEYDSECNLVFFRRKQLYLAMQNAF